MFSTLAEWLSWISTLHSAEIELGLERVKKVAERLGVLTFSCPIIIVGGTNGKGSTVAALASIYQAAGYCTGSFTSPILFKHNEQVKISGKECEDQVFCEAFAKIAQARGEISLTPFEFHTLAALLIFKQHLLDVLILEVGLGGRLDAVNILDASIAVITSIDLDHTEYLGETREAIAYEKAGIFRAGKPVVCGETNPPHSLIEVARNLKAPCYIQGQDFSYHKQLDHWQFVTKEKMYERLPNNSLALQNMATAIMTVECLQAMLPVTLPAMQQGLREVKIIGRVQIISGAIPIIFDVSHNPASIAYLAKRLSELPCSGKTHAVFSMLADKDIAESIRSIQAHIHIWYVAPLNTPRFASLALLKQQLRGISHVNYFSSIKEACEAAKSTAQLGDRIIVFGSFHTVAQAWKF